MGTSLKLLTICILANSIGCWSDYFADCGDGNHNYFRLLTTEYLLAIMFACRNDHRYVKFTPRVNCNTRNQLQLCGKCAFHYQWPLVSQKCNKSWEHKCSLHPFVTKWIIRKYASSFMNRPDEGSYTFSFLK